MVIVGSRPKAPPLCPPQTNVDSIGCKAAGISQGSARPPQKWMLGNEWYQIAGNVMLLFGRVAFAELTFFSRRQIQLGRAEGGLCPICGTEFSHDLTNMHFDRRLS
jgi:hypothetical protein